VPRVRNGLADVSGASSPGQVTASAGLGRAAAAIRRRKAAAAEHDDALQVAVGVASYGHAPAVDDRAFVTISERTLSRPLQSSCRCRSRLRQSDKPSAPHRRQVDRRRVLSSAASQRHYRTDRCQRPRRIKAGATSCQ